MTQDEKDFHPPFGEQDLSDDLFAEYLFRVGEGEQIEIQDFLSARGFSAVAVETFKKELKGYETYRQLLQSRSFDVTRIGPYKLERELGRGGMGRVFLAQDTIRNRQVALKLLAAFEPGNMQAQERFRREYETVTKLHHPHIVPMFEAGEADGYRYYSMEYIPGFTLDQVINKIKGRDITHLRAEEVAEAVGGKGPLWRGTYIDWVCWVMAAIGEALSHAHRRGIIHRDIKPSNILLSPSGRPYLFDFGLACGTRGTRITRTGEILGTPVYMAPEQIEGGKTPITHRTDIYGLGVTLYELLTLKPPFHGETAQEVAHRILLDEPESVRRFNTATSASLEAICFTAMAKHPSRRYATARALVQDIRNYMAYRPVQARPINLVEKIKAYSKKHPVAAAAVFAGVLLVPPLGWIGAKLHSESVIRQEAEVASLFNKGIGSMALGHWPKAEEFFTQTLDLAPESSRSLGLRGISREKTSQDRNRALDDYRAALKTSPDDRGILALQAAFHGETSPIRHAGSNGQRLEEGPSACWDHFMEGMRDYAVKGDYASAEKEFSTVLDLDLRYHLCHPMALLLRGCAYQKREMWFESLIDLTAYTCLEPQDPVGFLFLSKTLSGLGRDKESVSKNFAQAQDLISSNLQAWNYLQPLLDSFAPKVRSTETGIAENGLRIPGSSPTTH